MRELTLEELELISGGADTTSSGDIVVVADGGDDSITVDGSGDDFGDFGDYGDDGLGDGDGRSGDDVSNVDKYYPDNFDHVLDKSIDQLAKSVATQIAALPNSTTQEYGAIIWKDSSGDLHTTDIVPGTKMETPWDTIWPQVDFAHGGEVVSMIHSHPTVANNGSEQNPQWVPVQDASSPSSIDFSLLMSIGSGEQAGYDVDNYRSYVVTNGVALEFYAFQQDPSYVGGGGQATWANSSNDYASNTGS